MASKEEQFNKNVKNLPNELIYIIRGFVGSYYPFIEELKNKVYKNGFKLYHVLHPPFSWDCTSLDCLIKYNINGIVDELNSLKINPDLSSIGYSDYCRIVFETGKTKMIKLLKINKVKGRTNLIKEKNFNNMINALIKL